MNLKKDALAFGFHVDHAFSYHLDDYSTPDQWKDIGYELQYTFAVYFHELTPEKDRFEFLQNIAAVFRGVFGSASQNRMITGTNEENLWGLLEKGGVPDYLLKDMEPIVRSFNRLLFKVFWDKGPFDLRILRRLEDELNNLAILNHVAIRLANLIIIPRSKNSITGKILGIL